MGCVLVVVGGGGVGGGWGGLAEGLLLCQGTRLVHDTPGVMQPAHVRPFAPSACALLGRDASPPLPAPPPPMPLHLQGRLKSLYSTFKKMARKGVPLSEVRLWALLLLGCGRQGGKGPVMARDSACA